MQHHLVRPDPALAERPGHRLAVGLVHQHRIRAVRPRRPGCEQRQGRPVVSGIQYYAHPGPGRGEPGHRALFHQPAGPQHRDLVADLLDLGEQVTGQEHGDAPAGQGAQQRAELGDARRIHPVGRLVEQQQRGLAHQRGREAESLLHALGVALELAVRGRAEAGRRQHPADLARRSRQRRPGQGQHLQVAPPGEPRVEGRFLDHRAEEGQPVRVTGRAPVHPGPARGGRDQPEEDAQRGRLARAVRAQEAEHLARPDVQIQPVERGDAAVSLGQALAPDHAGHGGGSNDARDGAARCHRRTDDLRLVLETRRPGAQGRDGREPRNGATGPGRQARAGSFLVPYPAAKLNIISTNNANVITCTLVHHRQMAPILNSSA